MRPGDLLRSRRTSAGLTLRQLAARAGTSHSTLAAYEAGRVEPSLETLERVLRAAGYDLTLASSRRVASGDPARGRQLVEVLELAAMFPARHAARLRAPVFGVADPATPAGAAVS